MGCSVSSCSLSFKVLLGGIATVVFVMLLLVGALESGATSKMTTSRLNSVQATQNDLKDDHEKDVIGREKLVYNSELDLNYMMSKRRVPNGPDPIHNRRAGNSKRPPGRA
ncbi:CLAVATA3/ESR (CLE)-related protein 25-like [Populus nigra]|uniref:CLAVATA3/ESR (CLE)-related protein 25-like n=1 Tax=Populus nigra TaxID=3691 RepID=UPI002B271806|nr:CLAVATA3/ESR (CLE)-related protein 25-like [Populus nigra]